MAAISAHDSGQPGYGQSTTFIITQPVISQPMKAVPVNMTCTNCQKQIITRTSYKTGTLTWVACIVLCFVECDLGCCFIPFCVSSCKDTIYSCPNYKTPLGKHNRM